MSQTNKRKRILGTKTLKYSTVGSIQLEMEIFYDHGTVSARGVKRKRGYYLLVVPVIYNAKNEDKTYEIHLGAAKRIGLAQRFSPTKLESIVPLKKDIDQLTKHVETKLKQQLKK